MSGPPVIVHNASSAAAAGRLTRAARDLLEFFGDCERADAYDLGEDGESIRVTKGTRHISLSAGGNKPFLLVITQAEENEILAKSSGCATPLMNSPLM